MSTTIRTIKKDNPVLEAMLDRSSIRAYTDEKLTDDEIRMLEFAALSAPTAMNRQEQRFLFVNDRDTILDIEKRVVDAIEASGDAAFAERIRSRGGKVMYDAPLFVAIFAKTGRYSGIDAGIAVQNLALTAKSLGLDSVILGMPTPAFMGEDGKALQKKLGVSEELDFMIAISIGHRAMDKEPHEWNEEHIIHLG